MIDKLTLCKQTREIAADCLYKALKKLLRSSSPISEADLRNAWLLELRKHKEILSDGWYAPPPHGIIVLFGTDKDTSRTKFKSARPKEWWPRKDIFLDRQNGIILLYASPVDRKTKIIGDFEVTLYLGRNNEIIQYLKTCLLLNYKIFKYIQIGMRFLDVARFAEKLYAEYNLANNVLSTTDQAVINIGHTIPFSLNARSHISHRRIFVNTKEKFTIQPDIAFTIEPRATMMDKPHLPLVMYHSIALFNKNGRKELLTDFDKLFKLTKMVYMPNPV